jgi:hypothetical protein
MINPYAYSFQNVMYTINFDVNGIILVPDFTNNSSSATIG